jgi:O-acetyl-ADP-ribose deacetylase (regulator of RNase III)
MLPDGRMEIRTLYYITHINNIPSILKNGIMSHERMETEKIKFTPIYDEQIISRRQSKTAPNGKTLWSFANLYFKVRNPMLYRVTREKSLNEIAVLGVKPDLLTQDDVFIADGNAACDDTKIYDIITARRNLKKILRATAKDWWSSVDDSKREIMAECLVPSIIPPEKIHSIYVANRAALVKIQELISKAGFSGSLVSDPLTFFQSSVRVNINDNLKVMEGDMFLSRLQTLTVSVNTVGIMGKGLASRVKYQFPAVFVRYLDVLRNGMLKMGKPYLYKLGASCEFELPDEMDPQPSIPQSNVSTWFLLFATKRHWREQSDIKGIEEGLKWICENYKKEEIKSLALPALGCGLGGLEWKDVGPLMCRYLSPLEIPVRIYLPAEKEIPHEYLTAEYLLKDTLRNTLR